jgi:hypothetical protein
MTYKVRKTLGPPSRPDLQGPCVITDEHGKILATMEGFGSEEQYQLARKIVGDGSLMEEMARALERLMFLTEGVVINQRSKEALKVLQKYNKQRGK